MTRQAGDDRDPWVPLLAEVRGDGRRWCSAIEEACRRHHFAWAELHRLDPAQMTVLAAEVRALLRSAG